MAGKSSIKIKKHIPIGDLQKRINKLENEVKVLNRLHFINDLYHGNSIVESSEKLGITHVTGYNWVKRWNNEGIEGLIPNYGNGRPSKLSHDEKNELKKLIATREIRTGKEVKKLIKDEFNVDYSTRQISRILRELGFKYGKPYIIDINRPENAEEQLKKT